MVYHPPPTSMLSFPVNNRGSLTSCRQLPKCTSRSVHLSTTMVFAMCHHGRPCSLSMSACHAHWVPSCDIIDVCCLRRYFTPQYPTMSSSARPQPSSTISLSLGIAGVGFPSLFLSPVVHYHFDFPWTMTFTASPSNPSLQ